MNLNTQEIRIGDVVKVIETKIELGKNKGEIIVLGPVRDINTNGAWVGGEWFPFQSRLLNMRLSRRARK